MTGEIESTDEARIQVVSSIEQKHRSPKSAAQLDVDMSLLGLAGMHMLISITLLLALLPSLSGLAQIEDRRYVVVDLLFARIERADIEVVMILFTLAGGLLGGAVRAGLEAVRSDERIESIPVQLLHSMLGMMASLLLYAIVRGGIMGAGTTAADIQPWTLLVLATIASVTGAAYLSRVIRGGLPETAF